MTKIYRNGFSWNADRFFMHLSSEFSVASVANFFSRLHKHSIALVVLIPA
jgi:hypothetical protein